jgi:hypothetical protein
MNQPIEDGICRTCGFLCRRDTLNLARADYYEITREDRDGGACFWVARKNILLPGAFKTCRSPMRFRKRPVSSTLSTAHPIDGEHN